MTKRKAAPAAITQRPAPTLTDRLRYVVDQLMKRAAVPGPDGEPDTELGGLAIAVEMVAQDTQKYIARLTLQRDLSAVPTPWADEQAGKAARKHRDRADALAETLREVLSAFSTVTGPEGAPHGHVAEHPIAPEDFARWTAAIAEQPR